MEGGNGLIFGGRRGVVWWAALGVGEAVFGSLS